MKFIQTIVRRGKAGKSSLPAGFPEARNRALGVPGSGVPRSEFLNATAFTSNEVVYYRPHMRFATRADKKELWGFVHTFVQERRLFSLFPRNKDYRRDRDGGSDRNGDHCDNEHRFQQ